MIKTNLSRRALFGLSAAGAIILATGGSYAFLGGGDDMAKAEIYTGLIEGTGAGGYDVVAYHTESMAKPGDEAFTTEWHGATWRFASAENRDLFTANPEQYAPKYGGHCAWAVAQNKVAKGDPEHWTVVDGQLYLNFNKRIKERWDGNQAQYIVDGDANWPNLFEG